MAVSPLARKLHFKPNQRLHLVNVPAGQRKLLEPLPEGAALVRDQADGVLLFVHNVGELKRHAPAALRSLQDGGLLWIAYPKQKGGIETDLTRDRGWEPLHKAGWEGVSIVAVDSAWSALRFRPAESTKPSKPARMSDAAVRAKTGKTWPEWFALLDKADGKNLNHKALVAILHEQYDLGPWWGQMVAVGYEQGRGLRALNERPDGFQVGRSKTLEVSAATACAAWQDDRQRYGFLKEKVIVHKATPPRSLRITWSDGQKTVDVNFYAKGAERCQVTVQHRKLPDAAAVERLKAYWEECLTRLKKMLEK